MTGVYSLQMLNGPTHHPVLPSGHYSRQNSKINHESPLALPPSTPQPASPDSITLPRWTVHFQALLLGVVAATFFLLGMLVGSSSSGTKPTDDQASELSYDSRVSGKLLTKTNNREDPAIGGVVFALPRDRFPKSPLPSAPVTPKEFQALDNQTIAAIHNLGGAVSRVDENGQFDLIVDGGRSYFLFGVAPAMGSGHPVSESEMELLARFFQPAGKLTTGNQTVWKKFDADDDFVDLATLVVQ